MAKGVKIDNKKIAEIVTSYTLTGNYSETARAVGVSANSVKNIIEKEKKENFTEFAKVCEEKKRSFYEKADEVVNKGITLLNNRMDRALQKEKEIDSLIKMMFSSKENKDEGFTIKERNEIIKQLSKLQLNNLSEITTAVGTIYDKMRLEKGESTQNNSIEIKMSNELKELSK